jgi:hypothetical protein
MSQGQDSETGANTGTLIIGVSFFEKPTVERPFLEQM